MTRTDLLNGAEGEQTLREDDLEYARRLDAEDPLVKYRSEFIIPSKADLRRSSLNRTSDEIKSPPSIYLCGNSLGVQPRRVRQKVETHFQQWATKAVMGHFVPHDDSDLAPFLHMDDQAAALMAPLVGARQEEVAVMVALTANLHL